MSGNRALYLASVVCLAGLVLWGCPAPGGGGGPTPPDPVVTAPEITVRLNTVEVLSGGTMDAGTTVAGTTKDVTMSIVNTGTADLLLTGSPVVVLGGADAALFSVTVQPGTTVGPNNGTQDFTVRFSPAAAGGRNVTVTILSNDEDEGTYSFTLHAAATAAPEPEIGLRGPTGAALASGGSHGFASTLVGGSSSATFSIDNLGTADLTLGGTPRVAVSGADAAMFTVSVQPATPVAAAGTTTFTILFAPASTGAKIAALSIASNDADENPYTVSLNGTGTSPEANVKQGGTAIADNSGSFTFATTLVGATTDVVFMVENLGSAPLNLAGTPKVVVGGTDAALFSVTAAPASPVAAAGSTTFTVRFAPTTVGVKSATLSIANDDLDENPYNFAIGGTATAPEMNVKQGVTGIADAGTFNFPDTMQVIDAFSGSNVTFTVENLGTAALSLSGSPRVVLGGADAAMFTVTGQPAASVAAAGSTTFTVNFSPTATGVRTATLSIANNDANENPYNFTITGTATAWHGVRPLFSLAARGVPGPVVKAGSNVYVGSSTGAMSFVASTDGGYTWPASAVTIDSAGDAPAIASYTSEVYLSYAGSGGLQFSRSMNYGVTWPVTKVLDAAASASSTAIVASSGTMVYVAYYQSVGGDLKFVRSTDDGANWLSPVTLDSTGFVGEYCSMARSTSNLCIAYYDFTNRDLKLIRSADAGVTWQTPVTLDSTGDVGEWTSMVATGNTVYLSYHDGTNGDLKVVKSTDGGASWGTPVVVDSTGTAGTGTSIAVYGTNVYISYVEELSNTLKFARSTDGGATWPTIKSLHSPAEFSSLSFDPVTPSNISIVMTGGTYVMYARSVDGGDTW